MILILKNRILTQNISLKLYDKIATEKQIFQTIKNMYICSICYVSDINLNKKKRKKQEILVFFQNNTKLFTVCGHANTYGHGQCMIG